MSSSNMIRKWQFKTNLWIPLIISNMIFDICLSKISGLNRSEIGRSYSLKISAYYTKRFLAPIIKSGPSLRKIVWCELGFSISGSLLVRGAFWLPTACWYK